MKKCLKSFVEMVPQHEEALERVIGWSWHGKQAVRQRHPNKRVDDLIRWYQKKTRWKKNKTNRSCSFHKWKKECLSRCETEREKTGYTRNPARRLPLILGNAVINKDGRFRIQNRVEIVRHFLPVSPLFWISRHFHFCIIMRSENVIVS